MRPYGTKANTVLVLVLGISIGPVGLALAQSGSPSTDPQDALTRVDSLQANMSRQWRQAQQQLSEITDVKKKCEIITRTVESVQWFASDEGMRTGRDPKTAFISVPGMSPLPAPPEVELSPEQKERVRVHGYWIIEDLKKRLPCPPPSESTTAQKTGPGGAGGADEGTIYQLPGTDICIRVAKGGSDASQIDCLQIPKGLRVRIGVPDGMTSIDPPSGEREARGTTATGKLITTITGPGGSPVIIVEDPDGKRWISTDGGKTKHYFEPGQQPIQQGALKGGAMHRTDMSGGPATRTGNAMKGGQTQKAGAASGAQKAVDDSNHQIGSIQAELRELSGTDKPRDAILTTQGRIYELDEMITSLEESLQRMGVSQQELEQLKKDYSSTPVLKVEDRETDVLTKVLPERIGLIANAIATAISIAGRQVIKSINVHELEKAVQQGKVNIADAKQLLGGRYVEIGTEKQKLRTLKELDGKLTDAFNDRATAQARLDEETKRNELLSGKATSRAVLNRDTDPADEAKVRSQSEAARGVTLPPGVQPPKSNAPTITNKKSVKQPANANVSPVQTGPQNQNNELGQQLMQGVIGFGIQQGLGTLGGGRGGGGGESMQRHSAPAMKGGSQTAKPQTTTTAKPSTGATPAAPGGSFLFQGFTGPSDVRLKRDIHPVARHESGVTLYRYRYLWSDTEYVGVMAQEMAAVVPDAVLRGADGFLRVDYGKLGMRLMTWAEWQGPAMTDLAEATRR